MAQQFTIVTEAPATLSEAWGAYIHELPGVVGLGDTEAEARESCEKSLKIWAEEMAISRSVKLP